jgi:hypothetical protein
VWQQVAMRAIHSTSVSGGSAIAVPLSTRQAYEQVTGLIRHALLTTGSLRVRFLRSAKT